jgi:HPt (histidine-containing phosphotransfer) domain-containing protein
MPSSLNDLVRAWRERAAGAKQQSNLVEGMERLAKSAAAGGVTAAQVSQNFETALKGQDG